MAIDLPEGYEGSSGTNKAVVQQDGKSFADSVTEIPGAIYKAATGEDVPVEFPDIPEATDIEDIGFFESLIPNAKLMMARDDVGKAEIIKNSFANDPRFGGVFSDKHNNPMVVWNEKPYYINKPGFSGQDIGTFVGEIVKYSPATKFVSGAKTLKGIVGRGGSTYPVTELASEAGESILTPETSRAKNRTAEDIGKDVGTATTINIGADVVVPPAVKPVVGGVKRAMQAGSEAIKSATPSLPRYVQPTAAGAAEAVKPVPVETTASQSKYPLTVGQRGAEAPLRGPEERVTPQLQEEDVLRRSPGTDPDAAQIIRGFDEAQLNEIRADAATLQKEFGSGRTSVTESGDVPGAVAEEVQSIATTRADQLKTESGAAYKAVSEAEFQPIFSREGIQQTSENAINAVKSGEPNLGMTAREISDMPILSRELKYLERLRKMAANPKFKGQPLKIIHGYQKTLNRAVRTAEQGSPEQLALSKIKGVIDQAVFDGIEQGIVTGDQAILDQLKSATDLYRQYIGLTGKGAGRDAQEKAANKILEMVTNPNFTPVQISRAILGHAKFNPNQSMGLVIDKLKENLQADEFATTIALIKDGVLEKAFSGNGKSGVTRTNIVNNFDEVFVKQKAIVDKLFSPEEISQIKKFRENVMPTLWAEIKLNPSGTGYTILASLAKSNLLNYVKMVPILGQGIAEGAEGIAATSGAKDAIRQYIKKSSQPLFSAPISATIRMGVDEEVDASAVLPLVSTMSDETRQKVIGAANQQ
tara:strand:+ start:1762 stop:4035 length:2274 start_codon:yes stop_codon:yes gene_type:complete